MNSVASRAPRCWVSDRFHIRPKISFGNLARSKICLAISPVGQTSVSRGCTVHQSQSQKIPERTPLLFTSDLSKSDVNLLTSSGFKGGTRIGAPAVVGELASPLLGTVGSTDRPSNLGNGPAEDNSLAPLLIAHGILRCD